MTHPCMTTTPNFQKGDRVQHVYANLVGTIEAVFPKCYRVRWDHPGLAFAQLGSMADLPNHDYVEALDA